jgi:hypothetical protein
MEAGRRGVNYCSSSEIRGEDRRIPVHFSLLLARLFLLL